jgi:hypothetical protein
MKRTTILTMTVFVFLSIFFAGTILYQHTAAGGYSHEKQNDCSAGVEDQKEDGSSSEISPFLRLFVASK